MPSPSLVRVKRSRARDSGFKTHWVGVQLSTKEKDFFFFLLSVSLKRAMATQIKPYSKSFAKISPHNVQHRMRWQSITWNIIMTTFSSCQNLHTWQLKQLFWILQLIQAQTTLGR